MNFDSQCSHLLFAQKNWGGKRFHALRPRAPAVGRGGLAVAAFRPFACADCPDTTETGAPFVIS